MGLSKLEQETIIVYNNAEENAHIYTCRSSLINKLQRYADEFPDKVKCIAEELNDGHRESASFIFPKKYISLRTPKARQLSEEQRERMSKLHTLKGNNMDCDEEVEIDEEIDEEDIVE